MRLVDLNPRWSLPHSFVAGTGIYTGLSFDCPHCRKQRLAVNIRPPIDPSGLLAKTSWRDPPDSFARSGDTFENLTLCPSIRIEGHWHGHLVNGEISHAD